MILMVLLAVFNVPIGVHSNYSLTTNFAGSVLFYNDELISEERGSGRNVVSTETDLFWKECPLGEDQVILSLTGGEIYRAEYFSGPYSFENGLLISIPNCILIMDYSGSQIASYSIMEYPGSLTSNGELVWYVSSETGELIELNLLTGHSKRIALHFTPTTVEYGYSYLLIGSSDGGYKVSNLEYDTIFQLEDCFFAHFSENNSISFIKHVNSRGLETIEWESAKLDLLSGQVTTVTETTEPLQTLSKPSLMDDPAAHFDVPYMHQKWDTPNWFNGSWSCGPTSCMMASQYYNRLTPDSIWCSYPSGHWSEWGNYIPTEYSFLGYTYDILGEGPDEWVPGAHGFICRSYGGAGWNEMVLWLNQHSLTSAWLGTTWSACTTELDNLWPVIASTTSPYTGGHILLFNGYYSNHSLICNDSYGNQNLPGWGSLPNGKDVIYDWPGYNNGNTMINIAQLFSARSEPLVAAGDLIDDRTQGYRKLGPCQFWHEQEAGFDGYSWWTYSTGALPDTCVVQWNPELGSGGNYLIETFIPSSHATATGIYHINTASGWTTKLIDQSNYSNEWVEIGAFNLSPSSAQVIMGDYTGTAGLHISFDAMRFTLQTSIAGSSAPFTTADFSISSNPITSTSLSFFNLPNDYEGNVQVFDMSGRLALTTKETIPTGVLSPGLYHAAINDQANIYSIRFTVTE